MPLPTNYSFLGVAKEPRASRGTPVAATDFIPVLSMAPVDNVTYLDDKNMRGSMVDIYDEIPGVTTSSFDFSGDLFTDTFGYPLAGMLGDVVTTGASAPFSTAFSVLNNLDGQPLSFSLTDYDALTATGQARTYAGAQFSDLSVKFSGDGMLGFDAKAAAFLSAIGAKPVTSYSAVKPMAAYRGALTLGGSSVLTLLDGTVDMKRNVTPVHSIDGTANPYRMQVGPLMVSGKLNFVAEDETELLRYLNNTQPALGLSFSQGTGATANSLALQMSRCAYTAGAVDRGKDYAAISVSYTALGNVTDAGASGGYSQMKATLTNAKASGTYA